MAYTWQTLAPGVRVRIDPTRKHGKGPDKYFVIRYTVDGKRITEGLGWASEDMNLGEAMSRLNEYTKAKKGLIQGPKTKAEKELAENLARVEEERQARLREKELVTLADYWPEYMSTAKQKKKAKSWDKEESHFNNWLNPLLGHIPIRQIGLAQWDFLVKAMVDAGLSPRTRQYIALTLRQVMDHAFMRKMVLEAPPRAKHVGATLKPESNRRTRILTAQELQAILDALAQRDAHAYRLTLFCALTCCRAGEAFSLDWKNVDLSVGQAIFRGTKNGTDRTIPLSDSVVELLRGMSKGQDRDTGLVFVSVHGKPYRQAPRAFRDVVEKLGMNEGRARRDRDRVCFHTLRHTGATRLGRANTQLRDMMELAGWKTPAMALRYQHSEDSGRRRGMAALEGMASAEPAKVVDLFKKQS
jgi:integrase